MRSPRDEAIAAHVSPGTATALDAMCDGEPLTMAVIRHAALEIRAALAQPAPEAAKAAGEPVAWKAVEYAMREWEGRVVIRAKMEEAKEDGIAYAREQESRALMEALRAIRVYADTPAPPAEVEHVAREAAKLAWSDGWLAARETIPGLGWHVNDSDVARAVAAAMRGAGAANAAKGAK